MSELRYKIARNGEILGDWAASDIQSCVLRGDIAPSDFYWTTGMSEWAPVSQLLAPPLPKPNRFAKWLTPALLLSICAVSGAGIIRYIEAQEQKSVLLERERKVKEAVLAEQARLEEEKRKALEEQQRLAAEAKLAKERAEQAARDEAKRVDSDFRRLLKLSIDALSNAAGEAELDIAKREARSWRTDAQDALRDAELNYADGRFLAAARMHLQFADIASRYPGLYSESETLGFNKPEFSPKLEVALNMLLANLRSANRSQVVDCKVCRIKLPGGNLYYHAWGFVHLPSPSGQPFVKQWSAVIAEDLSQDPVSGAIHTPSNSVSGREDVHVKVWDVILGGR